MIIIEPAKALGIVGENFLTLEGDEIVKLRRVRQILRHLREGADHRKRRQQVRDAIFADETRQAADELWVRLAAIADGSAEIGHEAIEIFWMSLHERPPHLRGNCEERRGYFVHHAARFFEVITAAAAERALGNSR